MKQQMPMKKHYLNMLSNYISDIWTKSVVRKKVVSLADAK